MKLFSFKGGVKPDPNKTQSTQLPIAQAPLVSCYIVPLHQSVGGTPRPTVQVGDQVLKGQRLGEADGWVSAAVHPPQAPLSRLVHTLFRTPPGFPPIVS